MDFIECGNTVGILQCGKTHVFVGLRSGLHRLQLPVELPDRQLRELLLELNGILPALQTAERANVAYCHRRPKRRTQSKTCAVIDSKMHAMYSLQEVGDECLVAVDQFFQGITQEEV